MIQAIDSAFHTWVDPGTGGQMVSATEPWAHQVEGLAWLNAHRQAMLYWGMGCGKSKVAVDYLVNAGHPVTLILCPLSVIPVWDYQFKTHAARPIRVLCLQKGTVAKRMAQAEQAVRLSEAQSVQLVLVMNYESCWRSPMGPLLLKLSKKQKLSCVILDECHPQGVMISTPSGPRTIESLEVGDTVYGVDHSMGCITETTVKHTFNRVTDEKIIKVRDTRMTPEHPVWTLEHGYIPAKDIDRLDSVCTIESNLPEAGHVEKKQKDLSQDLRMVQETIYGRQENAKVLQPVLCFKGNVQPSGVSGNIQDEYEETTGTAGRSGQIKKTPGIKIQSVQRSQGKSKRTDVPKSVGISKPERRERKRVDYSTASSIRTAVLAHGTCRPHQSMPWRWVSKLLQTRHCRACTENRNRSGRSISPNEKDKSQGQKERRLPEVEGVDHSAVHKSRSPGRSSRRDGQNTGGRQVFNIETETGNYFADGLLVHNSHRVKSPRGRAALFVSKLAEGVKHRICLTGTPLPHSPLDAFSQWRFLDRREFGWNFHRFKMRYAIMGGWEKKQVVAFRNLDEMHDKIYKLAHRVKNEDALDLPEYQDMERTFTLSPAALKAYKELEKYLVAEVKGGLVTASNAMTKLLRLQQIACGFVRVEDQDELQDVDRGKRDVFRDILEDLPADEPVVVFCRFTRDVQAVKEVAAEMDRGALELSGQVNELAGWQDGKAPILSIQIQAGKEGVDMTRAAYAVYYSLGFSLGDYQQSRARLHRPGQRRNVTYIHILAQDTVDVKVMKALEKKADVIRSVLDDMEDADA